MNFEKKPPENPIKNPLARFFYCGDGGALEGRRARALHDVRGGARALPISTPNQPIGAHAVTI